MKKKKQDTIKQDKIFVWIALATGLVLLVPLVAMQFTDEVRWTSGDFAVAGVLIFSMASLYVLVARLLERKYRLLAGVAFVLLFLWAWAELAIGVFTNMGS